MGNKTMNVGSLGFSTIMNSMYWFFFFFTKKIKLKRHDVKSSSSSSLCDALYIIVDLFC